jgi:hypothetical protein
LYDFENLDNLPPEAESIVRYNQDHGAMLVTASFTGITYQFFNTDNVLIDEYSVPKNCADYTYAVFFPVAMNTLPGGQSASGCGGAKANNGSGSQLP